MLAEGTGRRRPRRRSLALAIFGLLAAAVAWSPAAMAAPGDADDAPAGSAASDDPLVAARALFAAALRDQEAGRFEAALASFSRVRAVRDTAAVEYRIASCEEALGRRARAYAAYAEAVRLGAADAHARDVVDASTVRMHEVARHLGRLSLAVDPPAPPDPDVRVDESPIAPAELGAPIALDPGNHAVTVAAPGFVPYRTEVFVREGADVDLHLRLVAAALAPAPAPPPAPEAARPASPSRTAGWVVLAGGALLVAGAGGLLWARDADIRTLDHACPSGDCPPGSDRASLESTRSRALAEGPAAIAVGAAGAVLAACGAYLLLAPAPFGRASRLAPRLGPLVGASLGGLVLSGALP